MAEGIYPAPSYGSPSPDGGHYENPSSPTYNPEFDPFKDSGDDAITKLAQDLNLKLDDATKGALLEYYTNEHSADNALARSREFTREQYSDMVNGLKKAGLNPFLAIQGLSGANQMSGMGTNSSGLYTQDSSSKRTTTAQTVTGIFGVLAIIAGAIIRAVAH